MGDGRQQLAEFLRARRELLQPEDVGLPRDPGRRVAGLRRDEVAALAGISVDYYLRLEQARGHQPSDQVLAALARALRLDPDADQHLRRIVHRGPPPLRADVPIGDGVARLLAEWTRTPAYVSDANLDVLAANDAARALAPGYLEPGGNLLLAVFEAGAPFDAEAWEDTARGLIAALRYQADPADPRFQQVLGRLSVGHRRFRTLWARHEARPLTSGSGLHLVEPHGVIRLLWQTLEIPREPGRFLTTFFAEPGTPEAAVLGDLALVRAERTAQVRW